MEGKGTKGRVHASGLERDQGAADLLGGNGGLAQEESLDDGREVLALVGGDGLVLVKDGKPASAAADGS